MNLKKHISQLLKSETTLLSYKKLFENDTKENAEEIEQILTSLNQIKAIRLKLASKHKKKDSLNLSNRKTNDFCKDCDSFKFLKDNNLSNLWQIAKYYSLDFEELKKLNKHLNIKDMKKGDIVYLPKGTLKNKDYDSFNFLEDNNLSNLWQIAKYYNLDFEELKKLNKHLDIEDMKKGDVVFLPKGNLEKEIVETSKDKKTILISWTFDDGPMPRTDELKKDLKIDHSTFFIVKSNMLTKTGGWAKNVKRYKNWVEQGATIGIHAQHESIDHIVWFPASKGTKYETYSSIEQAIKELKSFKKDLNKEGLYPKFVRLPGGLASQLEYYTKHFGFTDQNAIRNAVLQEKEFSTLGLSKKLETGYKKILTDFNSLKTSLKEMKLFLWKGTVNPDKISPQSWQAASSGDKSMNDDVTKHITFKDKRSAYHNKIAGKFERMVDDIKEGETRSLVILAHDTTEVHVKEVLADKAKMEEYAKKHGVTIKYLNMNELFNKITGKNVDKATPKY
jgi:LysM repeat protein